MLQPRREARYNYPSDTEEGWVQVHKVAAYHVVSVVLLDTWILSL